MAGEQLGQRCGRHARPRPTRRPGRTPRTGAVVARVRASAVARRSRRRAICSSAARATEALGSNNWVVDGTLTASGKPLLANDPHLARSMPSTWYLAHIVGRRLRRHRRHAARRAGRRARPQPLHRLGRDQRRRRRRGSVSRAARRDRHARRVPRRAGAAHDHPRNDRRQGRARRCTLDVRVTRHGPLVSDAINANNADVDDDAEAAAARAAGVPLDGARSPTTRRCASFLQLNEARNWDEFTAALRDFVVPSQNFVYADVDGHIGYYAPGRIPIRAQRRRLAAGRRLDRRGRVDRLGAVRRAAAHLRSARALHRHRQPPAGAGRLSATSSGSSGRSRTARSGSPICSPRTGRPQADAGRLRAHPGRHAVAAREGAAAAAARARARRATPRDRQALEHAARDGTSTRAATAPPRRSSRPGFCGWRRRSPATSSARC